MYNSHGIIAFKQVEKGGDIEYLVTQRRNSFSFIQLLRFFHKLSDYEIKQKISEITEDEAERLFSFSFDDIWEDMYINKTNKTFNSERHRARQNFRSLTQNYSYEIHLSKTKICEWGLPKGRRKPRETGFNCACREWKEETRIESSKLLIINTKPFYYTLDYGERQVCVECWLSSINDTEIIKCETSIRSYISEEVGNIEWLSLKLLKNILPHSIFEMLLNVENFIVENLL